MESVKDIKLENFINEFIKVRNGNNNEDFAHKVYKQKEAALNSRIAKHKGDLVDAEQDVETAEENIKKIRVNHGIMITCRESYVNKLLSAKIKLEKANEALEDLKATIKFLEKELNN